MRPSSSRAASRRLGAVLLPALLLLAARPGVARAQYYFEGYFGQNKVQYTTFDFQVVQTDHFDVHFYPSERRAALAAAQMAERSYARLSRLLNHRFTERKIIVLYASPTDFGQTNTTEVGEGTQGVTDFFRQRNVLYLQGAGAETEHVLTHEMVHQFQFDVFSRGRAGANVQLFAAVAPPLWFMEGMAEYLSLGGISPETAMWLRDAVYENQLPTIEQMTYDYRIFPYRYGHALWSYIGDRWGPEAVGAILQGAVTGGIEGSVKRTLGLSLDQLSQQWRDYVIGAYLPEVGLRVSANQIATPALTRARSGGRLHIAPAISPDGSQVAYFSERDGYSVDMFLADVKTGKVIRRLLKPTWSSNYETFRFLNSQAAWSPNGKYLAFAGRRGKYDDMIILDAARNKTLRRFPIKLDGFTTPSWSPDGSRLVFTGYHGGLSDLYVVNVDGTGLTQLTDDAYADLHPDWSPDGRTIAFVTDRGPDTDLKQLKFGHYRIALYDLVTGESKVLDHMDEGKNINPIWGPDGRTLAFVSDRSGVADLFLYDLEANDIYQLTTLLTGSAGFTPLSPVMSWARQADRIAFMYFEKGAFDVYVLDQPRARRGQPYRSPPPPDTTRTVVRRVEPVPDTSKVAPEVGQGGSIYRGKEGFRRADSLVAPAPDTTRPGMPAPTTLARVMDSAALALPDTSEFAYQPYRKRYTPDFIAQPRIGFVRDNFGNGIYGSTAISLSDVLGNSRMSFALAINGRINEGYAQAVYADFAKRVNWAVGVSQIPYFFALPSVVVPDEPAPGLNSFFTNTRRLIYRQANTSAWYPLSRFQRFEFALTTGLVDDDIISLVEVYEPASGFLVNDPELRTITSETIFIVQPVAAYVFDNVIYGYVGPFRGTRYRLSAGTTLGGWQYSQFLADIRRYQPIAGPVTFASRLLYYGRVGRDANQFSVFIGIPDIVRGHTSGSYARNECANLQFVDVVAGCVPAARLIGEQVAVGNFELRFPLLTPAMRFAPSGFPPIEGAVFFDIGMAWNGNSIVQWQVADANPDPRVRAPIMAWGVGARMNLWGLMLFRVDYAFPLNRPGVNPYVTVSLGPTF
jgi:Tol biopolymer transport system component